MFMFNAGAKVIFISYFRPLSTIPASRYVAAGRTARTAPDNCGGCRER